MLETSPTFISSFSSLSSLPPSTWPILSIDGLLEREIPSHSHTIPLLHLVLLVALNEAHELLRRLGRPSSLPEADRSPQNPPRTSTPFPTTSLLRAAEVRAVRTTNAINNPKLNYTTWSPPWTMSRRTMRPSVAFVATTSTQDHHLSIKTRRTASKITATTNASSGSRSLTKWPVISCNARFAIPGSTAPVSASPQRNRIPTTSNTSANSVARTSTRSIQQIMGECTVVWFAEWTSVDRIGRYFYCSLGRG